jgi:hypothetical protein
MGQISNSETSVVNQPTLRNAPEDDRTDVNRSDSLRYHTFYVFSRRVPLSFFTTFVMGLGEWGVQQGAKSTNRMRVKCEIMKQHEAATQTKNSN